MKLRQLDLLCALEQYHSFSKTAQHLFLSQPALSSSLRALEKELHCTLLIRNTRGVQFTPAGKLALEIAHDIQNEIMMIRSLAQETHHIPEHMSIASNTLTCIDLLTHVYLRSEQMQTPLSINFQEIDECTLIHQLLYNALDFALLQINAADIESARLMLSKKHPLTFLELKREPLAILVRREHPLSSQRTLSIGDLFPYRFITAHPETDDRLITSLQAHGYTKEPMLLEDSACLNQLIASSDYWAFVSHHEAIRHRQHADNRFTFLYPIDFPCFSSINWVYAHDKYSENGKIILSILQQILHEQEASL